MSTIDMSERKDQLVRFFLNVYLTDEGNEAELASLIGDDRSVAKGYIAEFRSRHSVVPSADIDKSVQGWVQQLIDRQSQVQSPLGALSGLSSRDGVWHVPHGAYSLLKTDANPYGGALHLPSSLVALFYHQGSGPRSLGMTAPASLVSCGGDALLAGNVDVPVELLAATTAWCHATGVPAGGDAIVKALKAAADCEPSIEHQNDENNVKALLAAVALKHGGRPQDYGLFLQECSLANPQEGADAGLACLEDLCMRKGAAHVSQNEEVDLTARMTATLTRVESAYRSECLGNLEATAMVLVHGDEAWRTAEVTPEVARARAAIEHAMVHTYHEMGPEVMAPKQFASGEYRALDVFSSRIKESVSNAGWSLTDTASVHIDEMAYQVKAWHDAVLASCGRGGRGLHRGRGGSGEGSQPGVQLFATDLSHDALTHLAASVYENALRWGPGSLSALKASVGAGINQSPASAARDARIQAMQASLIGEPEPHQAQGDVGSLGKGRGRS